jgi:hypothetical protein
VHRSNLQIYAGYHVLSSWNPPIFSYLKIDIDTKVVTEVSTCSNGNLPATEYIYNQPLGILFYTGITVIKFDIKIQMEFRNKVKFWSRLDYRLQ